ncbi:MAG TPA: hypothetical protein VK504_22420 [Vicinamibacterales bacterium]|jgi:hypothetical protein|nr:hypothetical protein [Vicinamibacterales bacterium]
MRLLLLMLALLGCVPTTASAVTIDEVVTLSKNGVSEQVIVALIERDQTLFTLSPALIMKLQRDGLSDRILLALIKSGRPSDPPLPAGPVAPAAALVPPPPAIAIVGHGPQLPNTSEFDSMAVDVTEAPPPLSIPPPLFVPVPFIVPVPQVNPHVGRRSRQQPQQYLERTANPLLCVERVPLGPSPFSAAQTRVSECPAVTQRYRK